MGVKVLRPSGRKDWTYRFAKGGSVTPDTPGAGRPHSRRSRRYAACGDFPLEKIGRDDWIRTSDPLLPKRSKYPQSIRISPYLGGQEVPFTAPLYLWNANQVRTDF